MAAVTTSQLLLALQQACHSSPLVDHVDIQVIDADALSVRIHLRRGDAFINVFYNVTTNKTAFALVKGNQRIYGVDNAKMNWHTHPFHDPALHVACTPVQFENFLAQVEAHYNQPNGEAAPQCRVTP